MSLQSFLSQLGVRPKESMVYLELLKLGAQPVSVIARHLNVKRTSMYVILERLMRTGLVEKFENHGVAYVKAVSAGSLQDLLHSKERHLEQLQSDLQSYLPQLHKLENKLSITPSVKFYEGKKAVMKMYEEASKEKNIYAFFNPEVVKAKMPEYLYLIPEIAMAKGVIVRELLVEGTESDNYKKKFQSARHQIRLLPSEATFKADTIIGKDRIFLISYGESQVSGTEIKNPDIAESQRVMFQQVWKNS